MRDITVDLQIEHLKASFVQACNLGLERVP